MKISPRWLAVVTIVLLLSLYPSPAVTGNGAQTESMKRDFHHFLAIYLQHIKDRDGEFLAAVHPDLPERMYDFFFDATLNMMRHAQTHGLQPTVTCREYGVCKVTWPRPNDSWAAQTFIRHEGRWRWLSE